MTANRIPLPVDTATTREAVARLLGQDAELPTAEELDILTLQLRGHLMLLIPEVEKAGLGLPERDVLRVGAAEGMREARTRLAAEPGVELPAGIAHTQRLARSVNALCGHLANLGGGKHP